MGQLLCAYLTSPAPARPLHWPHCEAPLVAPPCQVQLGPPGPCRCRPALAPQGRRAAELLAAHLAASEVRPTVVLCSSSLLLDQLRQVRHWSRPHGPACSAGPSPPGPHAAPPGPRSRPGGAALGERPVVIGRLVDQDDLDPAALATAPDDPAAGPDNRLGHDRAPRWVERASQALGHRALRRSR